MNLFRLLSFKTSFAIDAAYLTIFAHDILLPAGIVAVFTLRGAGVAETAAAALGDAPHESSAAVVVDVVSTVAGVSFHPLVAGAVSLVVAGVVSHVGVAFQDSPAAAAAASVWSFFSASTVLVFEDGSGVAVVLLVSVSVLVGRPFLSPPFNARGAPLVAPPRPPRKESTCRQELVSMIRIMLKDNKILSFALST
jgi:hypothetical protein